MKSRKKKKEFYTEYTARNALKNGSFIVRLSAIVFGLGCLVHKQIAKGILYLTSEILLIVYMVQTGFYNLSKFRTLGDVEQQKYGMKRKVYMNMWMEIVPLSFYCMVSSHYP